MFKPTDITEELLFCTTRIETKSGSCGTGFFFTFKMDDKIIPLIVTNQHVLEGNPNIEFSMSLHFLSNDLEVSDNVIFNAKGYQWLFHPKFDLCCLPLNPILINIHDQTGRQVFYKTISDDLICDNKKLEELTAFEHVIMVGYPMGLYDSKNNLPLLRNGYTSSHPMLDFQRNGQGVVDMACINGSSGSPIFIFNESGFRKKGTEGLNLGGRLLFLGVLYAGPEMPREGQIVTINELGVKNVSLTRIPINLGYYIKSKELLFFKEIISNLLKSQN